MICVPRDQSEGRFDDREVVLVLGIQALQQVEPVAIRLILGAVLVAVSSAAVCDYQPIGP